MDGTAEDGKTASAFTGAERRWRRYFLAAAVTVLVGFSGTLLLNVLVDPLW